MKETAAISGILREVIKMLACLASASFVYVNQLKKMTVGNIRNNILMNKIVNEKTPVLYYIFMNRV